MVNRSGQEAELSVDVTRGKNVARARRWLRLLGAAVGVLGFAFVAVFLGFHRKPAWFRPVKLDAEGLATVETGVANVMDAISDAMVQRKPFPLTLNDRKVNHWLAALPYLSPESRRDWPGEIGDIAVAFDEDGLRVGVHGQYRGWQTILGIRCGVSVSPARDFIEFSLGQVTAGAIPLMDDVWGAFLDPVLQELVHKNEQKAVRGRSALSGMDYRVADGVRVIRISNRFTWPNGQRPFRIQSIRFESGGMMVMVIEPL